MPREIKKQSGRVSSKDKTLSAAPHQAAPNPQDSSSLTTSGDPALEKPSHESLTRNESRHKAAADGLEDEKASTPNVNIPSSFPNSNVPNGNSNDVPATHHFSTSPAASSGSPPYHVQTVPRFASHFDQHWPLPTEVGAPVRGFSNPAYAHGNSPQRHGYLSNVYWSNNTTPENSPPAMFPARISPHSLSPPDRWPRSPTRNFASLAWAGTHQALPSGVATKTGHSSLSPPSHYYTSSDGHMGVNWPLSARGTDRPHGHVSFCAFDSLQAAGVKYSSAIENVLLVGSNGRLDVHGIQLTNTQPIGRLEGLRGSVLKAKVLPWTSRKDPFSQLRPMVAIVVHGPYLDNTANLKDGDSKTDQAASGRPKLSETDPLSLPWQTTVEVYSLKSSSHVTTLFKSGLGPSPSNLAHPTSFDDIRVDAAGQFILVASAISGEVFIFSTRYDKDTNTQESFECIGKVWTTVNSFPNASRSSTSAGSDVGHADDSEDASSTNVPLYSLSQRWLAYVPPSSSSQHAIDIIVCGVSNGDSNVPGLKSFTPPAAPIPDCATDLPAGDSLISQIARGVTQEFIKGANWVGAQGLQAWRNYWNPDLQAQQRLKDTAINADLVPWDRAVDPRFPPTHADPSVTASRFDNLCVSFLDLFSLVSGNRLPAGKSAKDPTPFATFSPPSGCSFLSLSPTGTMLLTISRDGDVQYVWDLMKSRPQQEDALKSHTKEVGSLSIRQVAKFSRLTNANVLDVVWSEPRGNKIAVLSSRGTAHVFDLPSSAFQWPPAATRQTGTTASSSQTDQNHVSGPEENPPSTVYQSTRLPLRNASGVASTVQSISNRAQPFVAAVRNRKSIKSNRAAEAGTTSNVAGNMKFSNYYISAAAAGGAKGGKAVVSGVTKSISAATSTMKELRSSEEARFRLNLTSSNDGAGEVATKGMMRFLTGQERGCFGTVSSGVLKIYDLQNAQQASYLSSPPLLSSNAGASKKQSQQRRERAINLPKIPFTPLGHAPIEEAQNQVISGFWSLNSTYNPSFTLEVGNKTVLHPLSFAEIETCAPFQPFYIDRGITLSTFVKEPRDVGKQRVNGTQVEDSSVYQATVGGGSNSARTRGKPRGNARDDNASKSSKTDDIDPVLWTFGRPIEGNKLDVGMSYSTYLSHTDESGFSGNESGAEGIETMRLKRQSEISLGSAATAATSVDDGGEGAEGAATTDFFERDCTLLELEE